MSVDTAPAPAPRRLPPPTATVLDVVVPVVDEQADLARPGA
jgi:hypothetical protein